MTTIAVLTSGWSAEPAAVALVVSGAIGRLVILAVMTVVPPVPAREGLSKDVGQQANWRAFGLAALIASPALALGLWFDAKALLVSALLLAAFVAAFRRYLMVRIGGVTGDCLGFAAYAGLVVTTLALSRKV